MGSHHFRQIRGRKLASKRGALGTESSSLNGLSYVADAAGVVSSVAIVRWTRVGLNIPNKALSRALVAAIAVLIGWLAYFLVGFGLSFLQPTHQAALLTELGRDIGFATKIIMAATIAATFYYYRSRKNPKLVEGGINPKPVEGDVRDRLQQARANIERRIESLQASPVNDYRGGVPQPDLIIEGLREELGEIDDALSQLGPASETAAKIDEHGPYKPERP